MRILLVEDEARLVADIRQGLEKAGYAVDSAVDGEEAWFQADVEPYDAMVLDLGLPRLDGLTVLKRLREEGKTLPILILTARDGWREKVEGIDAGADDYLTKPFRMEERAARLRALIRRTSGLASPIITAGGLELDTRTRTASLSGRVLDLTALEYRLLAYLMHRKGRIVSPGELIEHLYDGESEREVNALESLLTRLRRKLAEPVVETRRGHGYLIRADEVP